MRIANNIMALNAHRQLTINQGGAAKSIEKLSSGLRINRAGDDAAGLAISEKMRGQVRGLRMAAKNAQDAISLIQTAEGALNETHAILQRMRELAVQAASDTNTDSDRLEIQKEIDELAKELTRIANTTEFNTQKLLNGAIQDGALGELTFHIGANSGQNIKLSLGAMDAHTLGVARDVAEGTVGSSNGAGVESVDADNVAKQLAAGDYTVRVTVQSTTEVTVDDTNAGGLDLTNLDLSSETPTANFTVTFTWNASSNQFDLSGDLTGTVAQDELVTIAGVTINLNDVDVSSANDGDSFTVIGTAATAATTTVQLFDDSGNAIGSAVTIDVDAGGTYTIGNETTGQLKVTFAPGQAQAGDTEVTVNIVESSSASFAGGQATEAVAAGGINVRTQAAADKAITVIQKAIDTVSAERSKLGAYQNRLEHTIANLGVSAENLQAAESRIRDVDMAQEMMEFTKYQILQQASTAMLAQANLAPQSVLQLLG